MHEVNEAARFDAFQQAIRLPDVKLMVGLWSAQGDLNKSKERIGCGVTVVATLTDAQQQLQLLTQPRLPRSEKQAQHECRPIMVEA